MNKRRNGFWVRKGRRRERCVEMDAREKSFVEKLCGKQNKQTEAIKNMISGVWKGIP